MPQSHAHERATKREQRWSGERAPYFACVCECKSERNRGNGERQTECLHQLVTFELQRLNVRGPGDDKNSGRHRGCAGRSPHDETEPSFRVPRHLEIYFDEAKCCVERQGNSEPYSRASRIIVRQQHGTDESAHANSHKDGPQAAHKRSESTPGQSLPDIRRHQNRRRLRRGHQQSEQTDGHGRQAKSDGAFDKAGQQKDRGNHCK